jgi:hypothetical protein
MGGNRLKMKREIEMQIEQRENELKRLEDKNEKRKTEIAQLKAEAAKVKAHSRLIELQNELFRRIIDELDLGNITPQQAFLLINALKPSAGKESDLSARLSTIEDQLEKFKAETESIKIE